MNDMNKQGEKSFSPETLRTLRRLAGLSQAELAQQLERRQPAVSTWELGHAAPSTALWRQALAVFASRGVETSSEAAGVQHMYGIAPPTAYAPRRGRSRSTPQLPGSRTRVGDVRPGQWIHNGAYYENLVIARRDGSCGDGEKGRLCVDLDIMNFQLTALYGTHPGFCRERYYADNQFYTIEELPWPIPNLLPFDPGWLGEQRRAERARLSESIRAVQAVFDEALAATGMRTLLDSMAEFELRIYPASSPTQFVLQGFHKIWPLAYSLVRIQEYPAEQQNTFAPGDPYLAQEGVIRYAPWALASPAQHQEAGAYIERWAQDIRTRYLPFLSEQYCADVSYWSPGASSSHVPPGVSTHSIPPRGDGQKRVPLDRAE